MIGHVGKHRADDGNAVGVLGGAGKDLADFKTALAMAVEFERRRKRGARLAFRTERVRQRLVRMFCQGRFGIKSIDVRGTAVTEKVNDALGLGCKMRLL